MQLNDIVLLRKLYSEEKSIDLPEVVEMKARVSDVFNLKKRTEKARGEFVFRTCRALNTLHYYVDILDTIGLKNRIIETMWKFPTTPLNSQQQQQQ